MSNEATSPGHALRKVRTRNRLTQQQFATALGVSTREMMAIFQSLKRSGALQAELVIN